MKDNKKKALSASEKILAAADRLFYEEGIQAVGIDKIIKDAGVAMNTLYSYFSSKDLLVEQYLRDRDVRWRKWFNSYLIPHDSLSQNISHIFDALNDWFHERTFRGCAFINAVGELGDSKPVIYNVSKEHKDNIYKDVLNICLDSKINNPEKYAKQILLLMEGAIVRAYLNEDKEAAISAKEIALSLLGNYH